MLLATRCPHCETVFRLRQEQLALRNGLVRCGHCQQVFNAAESLVDEHAPPAVEAPATPAPSAVEAPAVAEAPAAVEAPAAIEAPAVAEARPVAEAPTAVETPQAIEIPAVVDTHAPAETRAAADAHASVEAPETPAPHAAAARLFVSGAPGQPAAHADFTPGDWDMWAPWLDGSVDPSLQHSGRNVSAEPLISVALPEHGAMPASHAEDAGSPPAPTPPAVSAQPEPAEAPGAHIQSAPPAHGATEPTPADSAAATLAHDAHEPSLGTAPTEPFAAAPVDDDHAHFAVTREARAPRPRSLLGGFIGGLIAAALAVVLVTQLAWWQRESVMVYWPVTQEWFQHACAPLRCTIAPPRAIDGLRLNASDLRQLDGPHVLELKAPLTNRYRIALAYPSIELTLLDEANHVTVRRVLAPRDYVAPGMSIAAGLPAGATQTMIVRLDTNGAPASNFRVQIFYP